MPFMNKIIETVRFSFKNPVNFVLLISWGAILLGYWRGINNKIPILGNFTDELEYIIVITPILLGLQNINTKLKSNDYLFWIICVFIYILNFVLFPENYEALNRRFYSFCFLTLPFYFIGVLVDIDKFLKWFYYISVVSVCICAFYELFYLQSSSYTGELSTTDYNMGHSYDILPHVLMVTWFALKDFKPIRVLIMLLGFFILLSFGTRGPVLCFIVFVLGYLFFLQKAKHGVRRKIIILLIGFVLISFFEPIMLFLSELTMEMGMSTRIFDLYFDNQIAEIESRDAYKDILLSVLNTNDSILGFGLLGSFRFIHTYPHKIWLEFIFSFGWILGCVLLALISIHICSAYLKTRTEDQKIFLFLLFVVGAIKLFMSGSFLDQTFFYYLLGYCTNIKRNKI